jgi:proteasome accessory factor A
VVPLEGGRTRGALDIQEEFLACARRHLSGRDPETDWLIDTWSFTLDALRTKPELLIGGVDWISKKWLLETFREAEGIAWHDPWMQSLDLEYHNLNPAKGLFFALSPAKAIGEFNDSVRRLDSMAVPPPDTRARGRGVAVSLFQGRQAPYVINWDSISVENSNYLPMPDPFETYERQVEGLME